MRHLHGPACHAHCCCCCCCHRCCCSSRRSSLLLACSQMAGACLLESLHRGGLASCDAVRGGPRAARMRQRRQPRHAHLACACSDACMSRGAAHAQTHPPWRRMMSTRMHCYLQGATTGTVEVHGAPGRQKTALEEAQTWWNRLGGAEAKHVVGAEAKNVGGNWCHSGFVCRRTRSLFQRGCTNALLLHCKRKLEGLPAALASVMATWTMLDPGVAGEQHYAKPDANNSVALTWTARHGHAEVCRLLMDPAVAGEQGGS